MNTRILKGNIIYTDKPEEFTVFENGYIVVNDGIVEGVFETLSEKYQDIKVEDYGDKLIIPGFVDTHLHAPQYENMGIGYDKELLPWLEGYTFLEERKYKDVEYAKTVYPKFINNLLRVGTTRASIFGTIHRESTEILFDIAVKSGIGALIGKVNMDRNSPEYLTEETEESIAETEKFIKNTINKSEIVKPIITPRFVPSCTSELMSAVGDLAKKYDLAIQSHLSENRSEVEWVKDLHPDADNYADVYKKHNLLSNGRTIMAHCVHSYAEEMEVLKDNGVFVAHSPSSNMDLSSGIAPIYKFLENGVNVGLATDIAGGHNIFMGDIIVLAIQSSKLYALYIDKTAKPITTPQAFYLATKGGGKLFGKVGSFENGYEFDALVIDDADIVGVSERSIEERLQKFVYVGDEKNIIKRFIAGKEITID